MRWIDMHCDTLSEIAKQMKTDENTKESLERNHLSVDIERLKKAKASAQFFACYVNAAEYGDRADGTRCWDTAYQAVLDMIALAHEEAGTDGDFLIAGKAADIRMREENSRMTDVVAGILTLEEGGVLNGQLSRLENLYKLGIRLVTLTWNYVNCIGAPNSRNRNIMEKGLSKFGIEVVEKMNTLGMIVDVSHLSDGGFWDCIRHSRAPVAASHSNARSICAHPRNLSDEMLRALGEKGGVAGLNFYSEFLRKGRGICTESRVNAGGNENN